MIASTVVSITLIMTQATYQLGEVSRRRVGCSASRNFRSMSQESQYLRRGRRGDGQVHNGQRERFREAALDMKNPVATGLSRIDFDLRLDLGGEHVML